MVRYICEWEIYHMATFKPKGAKSFSEAELKRSVALVGVLAYPSVAQPDENGKHSTLVIIEPDEETLADLRELVADHAEATFGERTLGARHHDPIRSGDEPSRDGKGYAFKHPAFRGKYVVRLKSSFAPNCVAGQRRDKIDPSEIRGGDHVVVEVSAFGFNNQSSGVGLSLNAIWQLRPGDVVIEKGGSSGSSFSKLDTSKLKFVDPKSMIRKRDEDDGVEA
jgi:hypothetical protein